jgi:hypothetical protein
MQKYQDSTQISSFRLNLHGKEYRKMRYGSLFLIGTLVFIVSCSDDTVPTGPTAPKAPMVAAASVTTEVFNEPFGYVPSLWPCTGEVVEFNGVVSGVRHTTINGNRIIDNVTRVLRLQGEGLSTGNTYRLVNPLAVTFSGSLINGQFSASFVGQFLITSQGPGNNLVSPVVGHVTVNANGDVTIELEKFGDECR